jgi:hypothetical protein
VSAIAADQGDERLIKAINNSWSSVQESKIPEHLHEAAFREGLRSLLAPAQGGDERPLPRRDAKPSGESAGSSDETPVGVNEADVIRKVAEETGVPSEKLERVFHIDDGAIKLIGQHTRFGSRTSEQARTIAQIVTIVRKTGMGASDTPFEVIKAACETKHAYDPKNFTSEHMPKIEGFVVKGEGRNRRLEARGPGITAFPGLIDRVLGEV